MLDQTNLELFNWYLHERESIRLKKERGEPPPWTEDPILGGYKFTNILRINDRTTQWVLNNWYRPNRGAEPKIQALNCAIFRYFGTMEFAEAIGYQKEFDPYHLINTANNMMAAKKKVFTGAYIITNGGIRAPKQEVVVYNYLTPFWQNVDHVIYAAEKTNSWESVCKAMIKLPGFGAFMGKEVALDMLLNPFLENCHDRLSWSPVGPGAIRGLNRLMGRPVDAPLNQTNGLAEMKDILTQLSQQRMFADWMPRLGVDFGVTDVQFSLCEVDKYLRVKNNEGRPRSKYNANR